MNAADATRIRSAMELGDANGAEALLPLVYEELRKLAAAKMAQERPGQTLQATALVHEVYLRLVGGQGSVPPNWSSRGHFFGAAAEAMRRILVDRARRRDSAKRRGNRQRLESVDLPAPEALRVDDLLDLDEALQKLASVDPVAARLVELRVFGGQSVDESAAILGLSTSMAKRTWTYARAWLRRQAGLDREPGSEA
jgi:RNA polymerase sigma factor (TIGR02999 family)